MALVLLYETFIEISIDNICWYTPCQLCIVSILRKPLPTVGWSETSPMNICYNRNKLHSNSGLNLVINTNQRNNTIGIIDLILVYVYENKTVKITCLLIFRPQAFTKLHIWMYNDHIKIKENICTAFVACQFNFSAFQTYVVTKMPTNFTISEVFVITVNDQNSSLIPIVLLTLIMFLVAALNNLSNQRNLQMNFMYWYFGQS